MKVFFALRPGIYGQWVKVVVIGKWIGLFMRERN
jgi:hypothetical protein